MLYRHHSLRLLFRVQVAYEVGRQVLGHWWGYLAGWMFLVANTVGTGVIALAFEITFMTHLAQSRHALLL